MSDDAENDTTPGTVTSGDDDSTDAMGDDDGSMTDSTTSGGDGGITHLGCFMDNKTDRVLGHKKWSEMMTPEVKPALTGIGLGTGMGMRVGGEGKGGKAIVITTNNMHEVPAYNLF